MAEALDWLQQLLGGGYGGARPQALTGDYSVPPAGQAFLDAVSGGEAPNYNTRYNGGRGAMFDSFADHPRVRERITVGPYRGQYSDAAGRYQLLSRTWDKYATPMGLPDFSPENQDLAAWQLAQDSYRKLSGNDLLADLQQGKTAPVANTLSAEWQSIGRNPAAFQRSLGAALAKPVGAGMRGAAAQPQPEYDPFAPTVPMNMGGLGGLGGFSGG